MDESYLTLSRDDRRDVLGVATTASGRPAHLLEKDVMVVWAVDGLFDSKLSEHLVFKGGTSLSKGYGIIKRFSEDIDVTYDVRQIIPDLAKGDAPLPATNAEAKRWRDAIDEKLPAWVKGTALPILEGKAKVTKLKITLRAEGANLFVDHDHVAEGYGYVPPTVKLEFGARSTGEPAELREIHCDAFGQVEGVAFPSAKPRLLLPKRTFWEKATAVHAFCKKGLKEDEHVSRHWNDLVHLDDAGHAKAALDDRQLAKDVAGFKSKFFRTTDRQGQQVDYFAAVTGELQLLPDSGEERKLLEADYKKMADDGILLGDAEPFEKLMDHCADLERRARERKD